MQMTKDMESENTGEKSGVSAYSPPPDMICEDLPQPRLNFWARSCMYRQFSVGGACYRKKCKTGKAIAERMNRIPPAWLPGAGERPKAPQPPCFCGKEGLDRMTQRKLRDIPGGVICADCYAPIKADRRVKAIKRAREKAAASKKARVGK